MNIHIYICSLNVVQSSVYGSASTLVSVSVNPVHLLFLVYTMEERLAQLMETIQRTNEQNAATFAKISSRFDEVAEMAAKKPKIDRSILEFKSKGNEDQFVFVEKIEEWLKDSSKELEKISAAITATVPDPPEVLTQAVAKAKRSLDDGMSLVGHCQKLIIDRRTCGR